MPKAKSKGNQHNNRHENGIVAPGKRVTKQKSNGHLNGTAGGSSRANILPLPVLPTARTTAQDPEGRTAGFTSSDDGANAARGSDNKHLEGISGELETLPNGSCHVNGSLDSSHRKVDANTTKSSMVQSDKMIRLALTILRSCPLGDTLTILIILLSLPTTVLTIINALFAVLTFMPPAGSFSSLPSTFNDIFTGSGGTPSLATILLTDTIGLVLWLVSWAPVQVLAVELTQAVVATTLGGGSTSKRGGHDGTLLCMGIVACHHVARNGWFPERIFGFDWSAILSSIPYVPSHRPSFIRISNDDFATTRSPTGWLRVLVALHILIQCLVHMARRWYQKRDYFQPIQLSRRVDPEAVAESPTTPQFHASIEAGIPNHTITSSEPNSKSTPISKVTRDKILSSKRKRKQGTYVRSQQPLWAALAATKVTVLREYEQTHSQSESAVSKSMDPRNLGDAPFVIEQDRFWISEVYPDYFVFHTNLDLPSASKEDPHNVATPGAENPKPVHARINDTDWLSTHFVTDDDASGLWTGEVYGLSPSSSYRVSFLQSEDGAVLYSATITTPSSLDANDGNHYSNGFLYIMTDTEAESSISTTDASHRAHRPSEPTSPTTTLIKSISSFEASLLDLTNRQKRNKKDLKAQSTAYKKEIDGLNAKIAKIASDEKATNNRHLQLSLTMRQADEAVTSIVAEIESVGCIPEDELSASKETKAIWDDARALQTVSRQAMFRGRDAVHREKASLQGEATTAQQKRERLLARKQKLNDQHDKLESATVQGLDDKERRDAEQKAKEHERKLMEKQAYEQISNYHEAYEASRYTVQQHWNQAQMVESSFHEQQMMSSAQFSDDRPLTPEGDLPGEHTHNATNSNFKFPAFGTPISSSGLRSHSGSLRHSDNRPRSTSMLSGNSVYTDFEDQDPVPPMPARAVETIRERGRQRSGGSNGGSSGSDSQRDPASPGVSGRAQDSPLGKKSPVWRQ